MDISTVRNSSYFGSHILSPHARQDEGFFSAWLPLLITVRCSKEWWLGDCCPRDSPWVINVHAGEITVFYVSRAAPSAVALCGCS